jgi:hypothetical protein
MKQLTLQVYNDRKKAGQACRVAHNGKIPPAQPLKAFSAFKIKSKLC